MSTKDIEALSYLNTLAPLLSYLPGSFGAMYKVYDAVSPAMPDDIKATKVKTDIPGLEAVHYNYDEGHAGRFTVPYTKGASVAFNWVIRRPNPSKFILQHLTFRATDKVAPTITATTSTSTASTTSGNTEIEEEEEESKATSDQDENGDQKVEQQVKEGKDVTEDTEQANGGTEIKPELAIFIPGLNTFHEPHEGETSTPERLIHYINVTGIPMSQIHIGTSLDQGDVKVDSGRGLVINAILNSPLIPDSLKAQRIGGNELEWDSRQLDRIQAALSKGNIIDTPVKESIRGLFDYTFTSGENAQPVTILAYSRATIEVEAALRQFINKKVDEEGISLDKVQQKLRERITIVTIGSTTDNFPSGPAYVHIASFTDPIASTSGVTSTRNSGAEHAGEDAVFLNCTSPYNPDAFDNHNFGAVTSQFLAVVWQLNKIQQHGFRHIWELGNSGDLIIPEDDDQLTRAMIQLTRGYEWLWQPEEAWRDVPFGALPSDDDAQSILREKLGDKFVDKLLKRFSKSE